MEAYQQTFISKDLLSTITEYISTIFTLVTFTQSTKGNRERRMQ